MFRRFNITKDLDVLEFEAVSEWGYARHKHNFFELTFILEGSGQHILNESTINYNRGDLFFLTPNDEHEFVVNKPSKFGIIKFTEQLFLERASFSSNSYWKKSLETVIYHSNIVAESIIQYENDKQQLFGLYELIKNEQNNSLSYSRNVLTELFGALLTILSRNIKTNVNSEVLKGISDIEKIDNILTYIRQNVVDKEKVRILHLADVFNMSPNYISLFIKKYAGISIQNYVIDTKMKMAERLLTETSLSISEVADKTGFVDSSHFNRTFKKYLGKNPSDFRKKL